MKKGRHRRFEEARALKRNTDLDINGLFDSINGNDRADGDAEDEEEFDDPYDPYKDESKWLS